MKEYIKLFVKNFTLKLSREMAYKWNFIIKSFGMILWDMVGPLIILLIYTYTSGIPGWRFEEFLLLIGTLTMVTGISEFLFLDFPFDLIDAIREGEFDLYLLKPYNPLVFLSLTGMDFDAIANVIVGIVLVVFAFIKLNLVFFSLNTLTYVILILFAIIFEHALMVLISSIGIIAVKTFALLDVFFKMTDIVRYPITIYSQEIQFFVTFLFPIAVMSFYPAQALMQGLKPLFVLMICAIVSGFWIFCYICWKAALKKYASAGG